MKLQRHATVPKIETKREREAEREEERDEKYTGPL